MKGKLLSLAMVAAAALSAQPAHASGSAAMAFPLVTPIWARASTIPCQQSSTLALAAAPLSKASAILGGAESALERMRRMQVGDIVPSPAPIASPAETQANCLAMPATLTPIPVAPQAATPFRENEFLSTRLLKIGRTPFDDEWRRVERVALPRSRVERLVGAQDADSEAALEAVNSFVNRTVRYRDDRETAGSGDYWQSAAETLRRGTGDCEDFAIAKYQMLRGLGFDSDDLYLTLARDLVRNVDHAVLIVRIGQRHLMLDDATDKLIDAAEAQDYRAMFSYGRDTAYMHGIPATPGQRLITFQ